MCVWYVLGCVAYMFKNISSNRWLILLFFELVVKLHKEWNFLPVRQNMCLVLHAGKLGENELRIYGFKQSTHFLVI